MTALLQPGDRVGDKYVIERLLGEGGMGTVYVARQDALGRQVAIKTLHATSVASDARARFEREARAAAALRSDHVARVLDVGQLESGEPYLVMDLLEGEDLAAALARRGPLPADEVVDAIVQACDALGEAHGQGIVHRDLKPANLFLATRASGGTTVKVLDFGVSKASHDAVGLALTQTASVLGSPLYMSPEQLREARTVDGRSDVWSLGVTMYELLSGSMPFYASSFPELCSRVLNDPPVPLGRVSPGLSVELEAVVMRCLEKDPDARFPDVAELVRALSAARGGASAASLRRPLITTGPSTLRVTAEALARTQQADAPPGGGRKWRVVALGAALAAVLGATLTVRGRSSTASKGAVVEASIPALAAADPSVGSDSRVIPSARASVPPPAVSASALPPSGESATPSVPRAPVTPSASSAARPSIPRPPHPGRAAPPSASSADPLTLPLL